MLLQLLFAVWLLLLLFMVLLLLLLLLLELDDSDDDDDVGAAMEEDDVIVVNTAPDPPVIVVDIGDTEPLRNVEDFKSFCFFLFNSGGVVDKFVSESLSECVCPALGTLQ